MSIFGAAKMLGSGIGAGLKGAWWGGKKAWGALKWIDKNPGKAGALALGTMGAVGLAYSGPSNINRSASEAAKVAEYDGGPSSGFEWGRGAERLTFEQSTQGLVQGMHRGRHR